MMKAMLLFVCLAGSLSATQLEPSFYVSFDGTAEAVCAAGSAKPLSAAGVSFAPGIKGQAVRIGGRRPGLVYPAAGNADARQGTVSFWYKPEWTAESADTWRFLFVFGPEKEQPRKGSGAVRVWSYDGRVRADPSDPLDRYLMLSRFRSGEWHHVAYVWSGTNQTLYVNGRRKAGNLSRRLGDPARAFETFSVSGKKDGYAADGLIDEFRLYTVPLTDAQVESLHAEFDALSIRIPTPYFFAGEQGALLFGITNRSDRPLRAAWRAGEARGAVDLPAHEAKSVALGGKKRPALPTVIRVTGPDTFDVEKTVYPMRRENPFEASAANALKLEKLDEVVLRDALPPSNRFVTTGAQVFRERNGLRYLEAGDRRGDRFAVRFRVPTNAPLCCFEFDYPDDADRIADVIVQPSDAGSANSRHHCESDCHSYQLQVGYVTGDAEYRPQHRMATARYLYWTEAADVSVVFATLRDGLPAAVAAIRLYKVVGGLPDAGVREPAACGGWHRSIGLYYEDPAIAYDFAVAGSEMPDFEALINRAAAYLKYTGQNLFVYPAVWYHGAIGSSYQPRPKTPHADHYLSGWFTKFDAEGLGFMPGINLCAIPAMEAADRIAGGATNGLFHATCRTALDTGGFQTKGFHHASPDANILHPDTQAAILEDVDAIIAEGRGHPSFRGIDVRLSQHCLLWLGDIHAGYNDYAVDGFTRDTGIVVPVDRTNPLRGKAYAEWLLANAREAWLDWRCRQVAAFHKKIAARLAAVRPDLCFSLTLFPVIWTPQTAEVFADPAFNARMNREAGIDPSLYADTPNIIISQGSRFMQVRRAMLRPAGSPLGDDPYGGRGICYTPGYYAALSRANLPWIHIHDYYWETSYGDPLREGKRVPPLRSDWFSEHHWRVTTMNPSGFYALKPYVLPLRYGDVLGITRGGFLIGTYGVENELIPFARAFRALPARRFEESPSSTASVKYRFLTEADKRWFYVVNTDDHPNTFTVTPEGSDLIDLATGRRPPELSEGKMCLLLAPYQLRSFCAR